MTWRMESNIKCGCLSYATVQGLGQLLRSFHKHGVINRVLRVEHPHYQNHPEWYPGTESVPYRGFNGGLGSLPRKFIDGLDVLFIFETPYEWTLLDYARSRGVRTVFMPMHEYSPERWPCLPDLVVNPSLLEQRLYPQGVFLPVPVDLELVRFRQRTRARVFVHNAGHGGVQGRNGTQQLLEAMPHVKSLDIRLIVRSQGRFVLPSSWKHDRRVEFRIGEIPYSELFDQGDVFVFPERFNGLSLPLQEAYASGMVVMTTDRFPMDTWLPKEPLIPTCGWKTNRVSSWHQPFREAVLDPKDIARTMDAFHDRDVASLSLRGKAWAEEHSWDKLGPRYQSLLEDLVKYGR